MSTPRTNQLRLQIASTVTGALAVLAIGLSKFISNRLVLVVVAVALISFLASLVLVARAAPRTPGRMAGRLLLSLLGTLAAASLALFATIYLGQDLIANRTNAFFQPQAFTEVAAARVTAADLEPLELAAPDGATLRGWLLHGSREAKQPLVIYFGGSGSESSDVIAHARLLAPWSVALINYRGFGLSTGTPSPGNTLADALLIYDMLVKRRDVDAQRVAAIGYSIGTGLAVHLAAERPVAGVALFAPYDRMTLINPAQPSIWTPFLPLMRTHFSPVEEAPRIQAPLLVLVGTQDTVFPPAMSQRLIDAWAGPARLSLYDGAGHTLSEENPDSWLDVQRFLDTLLAVN